MATTASVQIGVLSPATSNRPHFKSLDNVLPAGVSIAHEGLGLLGDSYRDLPAKRTRSSSGRGSWSSNIESPV